MRAVFRNEKYFKDYINVLQSILEKNKNSILNDETKNKRMKVRNCLYKEQILIASYSLGTSINEIQNLYSDTVSAICENWDTEIVKFRMGSEILDQLYVYHHDSILRLISIGVLIDAIDELRELKNKLASLKITNRLFDKMISYHIPNHGITSETNSYCPTAFNKIEKLAFNETINEKSLVNFQKNWYSTLNKNYFQWKDTHLNRGNAYFGYWSFAVAAIAKINSIKSDKLFENIFFPTDMYMNTNSNYQYQLSGELKLLIRIDELICKMGGVRRSTNEILSLRKEILKMKKPKLENIESKVNAYIQWTKKYNHEMPIEETRSFIDKIKTELLELKNSR